MLKKLFLSALLFGASHAASSPSTCDAEVSIAKYTGVGAQIFDQLTLKTITLFDITVFNKGPCDLLSLEVAIDLPTGCLIQSITGSQHSTHTNGLFIALDKGLHAGFTHVGAGVAVACPFKSTPLVAIGVLLTNCATCSIPPTHAPTPAPTRPPTHAPTPAPTRPPTHAPTPAPTRPPTHAPTPAPTRPPTHAPTPAPTRPPTHAPTPAPTRPPTHAPTPAPTPAPPSFLYFYLHFSSNEGAYGYALNGNPNVAITTSYQECSTHNGTKCILITASENASSCGTSYYAVAVSHTKVPVLGYVAGIGHSEDPVEAALNAIENCQCKANQLPIVGVTCLVRDTIRV